MSDQKNEAAAGERFPHLHRRRFLQMAGLAGMGLMIPACKKDDNGVYIAPDANMPGVNPDGSINLGGGDLGILNYAYLLEQLESNFYERVLQSPYSGMSAIDRAALTDIRDIEITHREFYKKALGIQAIPKVEFEFATVNFADRISVLMAARNFEDTGVSAYNGSGRLLTDPSNLATAGKIASVESRNGSLLRYIMGAAFFEPSLDHSVIIDANGLDLSAKPSEVLAAAAKFVKAKIDSSHLPTY